MSKDDGAAGLFETKGAKGRMLYQLYGVWVVSGICLICIYRVSHLPAPGEVGRWAWMGLFAAELWFCFYWFLSQFVRWNPIYRSTFKHTLSLSLSQRSEKELVPAVVLPGVDIFVCTADPKIEPPIMVVNTVLSVMAYDYPPEKLSVYLSDDDGGSDLTFYALIEASRFSKHWLPFCKKFKVEPRSPNSYFSTQQPPPPPPPLELDDDHPAPLMSQQQQWSSIKKLYEEMAERIETATASEVGIPEEIRKQHKGFGEWRDSVSTRDDHQPIIQIIIDGRDGGESSSNPLHNEGLGLGLPTLVYVAREKRSKYPTHFKAGAMNALIRVSSMITNGSVILNVDCDVYSNNSESVKDALCFFMDTEKGHDIAYVQYPQNYDNLTKNDVYASCFRVINELEMAGMDGNGGVCYIGSGCFHRRASLCGVHYSKGWEREWMRESNVKKNESAIELEERCKVLASCTYEDNTEWGKEMGLKYGFPAEDIVTGLAIKCRGWRSVYFNPERKGFVGVAPTTLLGALIQHKRWSEGLFKIGLSKCCPFLFDHKKLPLKLQFSYSLYILWAPNCLPTLYYVLIPSICLLKGISLFPKVSSLWIVPFAYVFITKYTYSLGEFLCCGGTIGGWWNEQRIWLFRRTTSYFFAFVDSISSQLGFSMSGFVVTTKVTDEGVSQRYAKEVMEFGSHSWVFTILATLAMLNLFSFIWGLKMAVMDFQITILESLALQIVLCGLLVVINLPVYQGLFFRKDKGKMPTSVTYMSVMLAISASTIALF